MRFFKKYFKIIYPRQSYWYDVTYDFDFKVDRKMKKTPLLFVLCLFVLAWDFTGCTPPTEEETEKRTKH